MHSSQQRISAKLKRPSATSRLKVTYRDTPAILAANGRRPSRLILEECMNRLGCQRSMNTTKGRSWDTLATVGAALCAQLSGRAVHRHAHNRSHQSTSWLSGIEQEKLIPTPGSFSSRSRWPACVTLFFQSDGKITSRRCRSFSTCCNRVIGMQHQDRSHWGEWPFCSLTADKLIFQSLPQHASQATVAITDLMPLYAFATALHAASCRYYGVACHRYPSW